MLPQRDAFRLTFRLLILLALTLPCFAAVDWPPITPEEQALKDVPQQPGAPAVILYREQIEDDDQQHDAFVYERIKILTEAGRRYANIVLPYRREYVTLGNLTGRTVHADGTVIPFDGQSFDKMIQKSHGIRVRAKSFTLPDAQVGSILEYRYTVRFEADRAFSPQWLVQLDLFQKKAVFKFTPTQRFLVFSHDRVGKGVAWTTYLPKQYQPQERDSVTSHWIELDAENIPPFVEEPHMPPLSTLQWRVDFYYRLGEKEEAYWKDEGKFWNEDVEHFLGHKSGVDKVVAEITAPGDTPGAMTRKIYAYVTKLENRSYIPFRPQQEEHVLGLKPNDGAEDVLRQRSGTHDDLNRLFVAMARQAGIPAWLMRVPRRDEMFFEQHLLSANQFDAEVAIVQLNGKEIFLDPGSRFCPYGLLDWRYSNTGGLRQSAAKGVEFGESPLSTYNQAFIQRSAQLKLTDQGTADGTAMVAYFGLEAMERRQQGGKTDAEGRKKMLEDEIKGWLPGGSDATLTNVPEWDQTEGPLLAEFKISGPMATAAGKHRILPVYIFQVNQAPMFSATERVNPIYFDYPSRESDQVQITLPDGFDVESLPPDSTLHLDYAQYKAQVKQAPGNVIVANRELTMGGMAFPATAYKEVKDLYDKVKAADGQSVVLKGGAHVAER